MLTKEHLQILNFLYDQPGKISLSKLPSVHHRSCVLNSLLMDEYIKITFDKVRITKAGKVYVDNYADFLPYLKQLDNANQTILALKVEKEKSENERLKAIQIKDQALRATFITQEDLNTKRAEMEKLNAQIADLKSQIIELDEQVLLQDLCLYEPTYDFVSCDDYKDELQKIRQKQKAMLLQGTAAKCRMPWTINGSKTEGDKFIKDIIQQALTFFNSECEYLISKVKFSNFYSIKERIYKTFNKINKMNKSSYVMLDLDYCELKIQELTLAYDYERKLQEEREHIKEQRAIEKERRLVERELAVERSRIEKEKNHYENRLSLLNQQLNSESNEARKELISEKIEAVKCELIDLSKALEEVDYREANERAGYVYIISNIGSFGKNVYKIGMTRRLDPLDRISELSGASVPFKFDVHALIFSTDAPKLETELHNAFAKHRVNLVNNRKEFYRIPLEEIKKVVLAHHDNTVNFTETPEAQQFRETEKMRELNVVTVL